MVDFSADTVFEWNKDHSYEMNFNQWCVLNDIEREAYANFGVKRLSYEEKKERFDKQYAHKKPKI
tara:strand:+ start:26 stop:220 length:195 start_codon:yes stop_codon:yes gene_type:complete